MKKTYINPNMEVIKIASHAQMLAGSNLGKGTEYDGTTPKLSREMDFDED